MAIYLWVIIQFLPAAQGRGGWGEVEKRTYSKATSKGGISQHIWQTASEGITGSTRYIVGKAKNKSKQHRLQPDMIINIRKNPT